MRPDILIVGQGLAGTLLAWELEQAGISFAIADAGHARAASIAGAGIINPITGRRLVKSWRVGELLPLARDTYRGLEAALGLPLWHELRVRRIFVDDGERAAFAAKAPRGELAPFARGGDENGFWIEGAARVDVAALLRASRERWRAQGKLQEIEHGAGAETMDSELVIDCRGREIPRAGGFGFVPWEFSRGQLLELEVEGLDPDVVRNARRWLLPIRPGLAWLGATHEPGVDDPAPTSAGRSDLEASAGTLLGHDNFRVLGQRAGVRVGVPDRRPAAGRHPERPKLGLAGGLAAKGALWAPLLARQWRRHLQQGASFDREIDVARFWPCHSSQASSR